MCVQGDDLRSDQLAFLSFPRVHRMESSEAGCPAPFHVLRSLSEATGCL